MSVNVVIQVFCVVSLFLSDCAVNLCRNCEMSATDTDWMVSARQWKEKNAATAHEIATKTSYHVSSIFQSWLKVC